MYIHVVWELIHFQEGAETAKDGSLASYRLRFVRRTQEIVRLKCCRVAPPDTYQDGRRMTSTVADYSGFCWDKWGDLPNL
jgi:hypothetical protein